MRPIQLWIPNLYSSPYLPEIQRDRDRAFASWRGEDTVWLLPGLESDLLWMEDKGLTKVRAIGAEHLDRLDVYHVGSTGGVWGRGVSTRFRNQSVSGLLQAWLNIGDIEFYMAPESITFEAPRVEGNGVRYCKLKCRLGPMGALPIDLENAEPEDFRFSSRWPPDGKPRRTVSPDQEGREHFGAFERDEGFPELPIFRRKADPSFRTLHVVNRWPSPFDVLVPPGAGADEMKQYASMVKIALSSGSDPEGSLHEARHRAAEFVSDGVSTWEHAHLLPIYGMQGEEAALLEAESRFDVSADTLPNLLWSEAWQEKGLKTIQVCRTWGIVGLMWALLIEELENRRSFTTCERCGRTITGRRGKRFCSRSDSLECFLEGQRIRSKRSRSLRSTELHAR